MTAYATIGGVEWDESKFNRSMLILVHKCRAHSWGAKIIRFDDNTFVAIEGVQSHPFLSMLVVSDVRYWDHGVYYKRHLRDPSRLLGPDTRMLEINKL